MQQLTTQTNGFVSGRQFNTRALYLQIADDVSARINAGEWKPGSILPNEGEFARLYGISHGTMRSALNHLESKGILTRKQGRGTFVNDKEADDQQLKLDCIKKALLIIRESIQESGAKKVSSKLQTCLQAHFAQALVDACSGKKQ